MDVTKPAGVYFPDLVHQFALDFIDRNAGGPQPFYLYYSLIAPHPPYVPTPDNPSETDEAVMLPTFCDVVGYAPPAQYFIDGRSFAPLLRREPGWTPREWVYFQIENNWCLRGPAYRLNRDGRFFDLSDMPFSMTEITTLSPEQQLLRDAYQAVLDEFHPANGPTYEAHQDNHFNETAWNWKRDHFNSADQWDTAISGDLSDPDGDGVVNRFERAFGWDPADPSTPDQLPKPALVSNALEMTYTAAVSDSDSLLIPEVSGNLVDWDSGPSDLSISGTTQLIARDLAEMSDANRRFMRLRVERATAWAEP